MSKALQVDRYRLVERGLRRMEVSVSSTDADLFRRLARVLTDNGTGAEEIRKVLRAKVQTPVKFKDWLASLPDNQS
jgi:molybdenum cofactor biosynthesis enzyme MoaA